MEQQRQWQESKQANIRTRKTKQQTKNPKCLRVGRRRHSLKQLSQQVLDIVVDGVLFVHSGFEFLLIFLKFFKRLENHRNDSRGLPLSQSIMFFSSSDFSFCSCLCFSFSSGSGIVS